VRFRLEYISGSGWAWWDALYARRCLDANVIIDGTLTTIFARYGNWLASTNNNHALVSSTTPPVGVYMSGQPFTTVYTEQTFTAGSFLIGQQYQIVSAGTTSWASCGTSWIGTVGAVGSIFTATAAGSGSGTANHCATDCIMELGGSVNLQGYPLAGLAVARLYSYPSSNGSGYYNDSNTSTSEYKTGTWTAPPCGGLSWYRIRVSLIAAGQGGGGLYTGCYGGAAGGFFQGECWVQPGQTYSYCLGPAGAGLSTSIGAQGGAAAFTAPVTRGGAATTVACIGGGHGQSTSNYGGGIYQGPSAIGAMCSFAGTVMTCNTAPVFGAFAVGQLILTGSANWAKISSFGTGTGGTGTYNLDSSAIGTLANNRTDAVWPAATASYCLCSYQPNNTGTNITQGTSISSPVPGPGGSITHLVGGAGGGLQGCPGGSCGFFGGGSYTGTLGAASGAGGGGATPYGPGGNGSLTTAGGAAGGYGAGGGGANNNGVAATCTGGNGGGSYLQIDIVG
jgi:hypothetical protein